MLDEIEIDLDGLAATGHWRGGQSSDRHVEWYLPPVVQHGRQGQADFPDDLGPEMQGGQPRKG